MSIRDLLGPSDCYYLFMHLFSKIEFHIAQADLEIAPQTVVPEILILLPLPPKYEAINIYLTQSIILREVDEEFAQQ